MFPLKVDLLVLVFWSNTFCNVVVGSQKDIGNCVYDKYEQELIPDIWKPVCGPNNTTYGNCYEARQYGQLAASYEGECSNQIQEQLTKEKSSYKESTKAFRDSDVFISQKRRQLLQRISELDKLESNQFLQEVTISSFEIPNGFPVPININNLLIPDNKALAGFVFEAIIGDDERIRVPETSRIPWNAIGQIGTRMGFCTGTLIGPRFVLTAGHCIIDASSGQQFDDLDFYPGKNHDINPYGQHKWEYALVNHKWSQERNPAYDYGLIVLESPIADIPPMAVGSECGTRLVYTLNIVGYPFDKFPSDAQWTTACTAVQLNCTEGIGKHDCDTQKGMSGAPMFVFRKDDEVQFSIRAIHTAKFRQDNVAVIITDESMRQLLEWMGAFEE